MNSKITKHQASKFLLIKHGLLGEHTFIGKEGILSFVKQAGCIQYDPIDVCGKNHELVLQSRVPNFEKGMLQELLYKDRALFDWFDKNQAIMPISDWPYFEHHRMRANEASRHKEAVDKVSGDILKFIQENGAICSSDLDYQEKVDWSWSPTSLSRAALETMYLRGELIISDKKNTRRIYDITRRHMPQELLSTKNPNTTAEQINKWHLLRRIGGVGMLHNKASDAFLGMRGFKAKERNHAFEALITEKVVMEIEVEGSKLPFYIKREDASILEMTLEDNTQSDRLEFIAPLDNLIWDRKIIEELFGFSYKWEIYTPVKDRKYGYYVLPILHGDKFIGRIELKRDRVKKKIEKLGLWWEDKSYNSSEMKKKVKEKLKRFNEVMY